MPDSLIEQGFLLMLAGMGTVYVFLTALVLAMNGMSWLLARLPEPPPPPTGPGAEEVAAISAAIRKHRSRNRGT